jgi:hypothetical protein
MPFVSACWVSEVQELLILALEKCDMIRRHVYSFIIIAQKFREVMIKIVLFTLPQLICEFFLLSCFIIIFVIYTVSLFPNELESLYLSDVVL